MTDMVFLVLKMTCCVVHRHLHLRHRHASRCLLLTRRTGSRCGALARRVRKRHGTRGRLGNLVTSHFSIVSGLKGACCRHRGATSRRTTVFRRIGRVVASFTRGGRLLRRLRLVMGAYRSGTVRGLQGSFPTVGRTSVQLLYCVFMNFSPRMVDLFVGSAMTGMCTHGSQLGSHVGSTRATGGRLFLTLFK